MQVKRSGNTFLGCNNNLPDVVSLLNDYQHLSQSNPYVGDQYITMAGGVLTIVGIYKKVSNRILLACHCSLCVKDKELFPEGGVHFYDTISHIKSGRGCCGCSNRYKYSEQQTKIRDSRVATDNGYKILYYLENPCSSINKMVLECPLCSDDKELWPSGSIVSDRHSIKSGVKSCGCAKSPKLKEWQHEILVKRNIEGVGFEFKGWCGSYGKQDTKVKLFNPKTGNEWCNNSIKEIIGSKYNDPLVIKEERSVRKRIPDEIHIRDIQESGNYVKGTKFFRGDVNEDNTVSRDWYYTCPICSVDEYVTEGVCTGIFKTGLTRLKSGILACRCAKNYRPTLEQLKFKLEGLCKEDNFEFIGVVHWDGVKGSKFKWVCNKGHTNTNLAGNFIKGARCRSCGDACNGYYKDRVNEKDYLYLPTFEYNDGTNHIKCGRTFRPEKRFLELKESSGAVFVENNYLWTGSHEEVYRVEQVIKDTMYSEGYNYFNTMTERPFHGSTECYEKSEDVISLIIHIVNSSDLELC